MGCARGFRLITSEVLEPLPVVAVGRLRRRPREEGLDDMPAQAKSSLLSPSVSIAVRDGRLVLGQYQDVHFCEHRGGLRPRTTMSGRRSENAIDLISA